MTEPLRVLAVEDAEDDAALLARALAKGGYAPVTLLRVETGAELAAALDCKSTKNSTRAASTVPCLF